MKVLIHYEDNDDPGLHKSMKITLPKSWKTGPTSNLLDQFVEFYNPKFESNQLAAPETHLCIREAVSSSTSSSSSDKTQLVPLCSDDVVVDTIPDRGDVYVCHGASETKQQKEDKIKAEEDRRKAEQASTVACTHFGCKNRFPRGGPYPECRYHKMPPVFHETAKYWACCPDKKAYDWDEFQNIPGCEMGRCTDVKDDGQTKAFFGGSDLREQANGGSQLKSIDDFNKAQDAGGAAAAPILERLQNVFAELDIEAELFNQVVDGMKKDFQSQAASDAELLELVAKELGGRLKKSMKAIAVEQLRIK
mmetsp:Transcript_9135/g.26102  ORF Transcript_9135/g.26102 Transcript_9135/m.26102 type:complete len:306 (+) Transcript_9135:161-1078(+)|eukprot:CAMPEP_0119560528 /NCGR_PEP_ID=MMETSP1352-20130426/15096_1 /TAXON_ID=265584 /ORGANISM="Stauroneis constricta, Strain CCMP1120" /LENGTH=305 /DNA_ID=CAMNT_0007608521 /DNA_START=80 /DNA_END=997 /DNA_ORIENTATION=+